MFGNLRTLLACIFVCVCGSFDVLILGVQVRPIVGGPELRAPEVPARRGPGAYNICLPPDSGGRLGSSRARMSDCKEDLEFPGRNPPPQIQKWGVECQHKPVRLQRPKLSTLGGSILTTAAAFREYALITHL